MHSHASAVDGSESGTSAAQISLPTSASEVSGGTRASSSGLVADTRKNHGPDPATDDADWEDIEEEAEPATRARNSLLRTTWLFPQTPHALEHKSYLRKLSIPLRPTTQNLPFHTSTTRTSFLAHLNAAFDLDALRAGIFALELWINTDADDGSTFRCVDMLEEDDGDDTGWEEVRMALWTADDAVRGNMRCVFRTFLRKDEERKVAAGTPKDDALIEFDVQKVSQSPH